MDNHWPTENFDLACKEFFMIFLYHTFAVCGIDLFWEMFKRFGFFWHKLIPNLKNTSLTQYPAIWSEFINYPRKLSVLEKCSYSETTYHMRALCSTIMIMALDLWSKAKLKGFRCMLNGIGATSFYRIGIAPAPFIGLYMNTSWRN